MARSEYLCIGACPSWRRGHELRVDVLVQALALCAFLDDNRHMVDMQGKEVLELGAGTGLVTIVASLLGVYPSIYHTHKKDRASFCTLPTYIVL